MSKIDKDQVVGVLNRLLEAELAGVVRYTHYSLLVFGFGRIPIVSWLRDQANESLLHAQQVGEWITTLGAYPSLVIGPLLDSHKHDIAAMLRESLEAEGNSLELYRELLALVEGRSVALEEFARQMIYAEELHAAEVDKMLRKPGELAAVLTTSRLTRGKSDHLLRGPYSRPISAAAMVVAGSRPSTVGARLVHMTRVTPFTGSWPMNEL